jgi:hypothetical protein
VSTTENPTSRVRNKPFCCIFRVTSHFCKIRPTSLARTFPVCSLETLPTTSLLSSVTELTPSTLTRAPPSPSIHSSLWALETDDTYKSSILAASPSVQSISFPEPQDISFDTSILRPTASGYTSQEPSRLSTITESCSSESPSIISSSPLSPSLTLTAIVSVSSPSLPPTVRSPLLQDLSSTTVVTLSLSPRPLY